MTLRLVSVSGGVADVGDWGSIRLTGAASAVVIAHRAPDIEVPAVAAEELANAALVVNEEEGELLVLPYSGEAVARVTMTMSDEQYSLLSIPRDGDAGMRSADLRFIDDAGVLFITECSLLLFDAELRLAWRVDDDFLGWGFESVEAGHIELGFSDWSGNETRQVRSLRDGRRVG